MAELKTSAQLVDIAADIMASLRKRNLTPAEESIVIALLHDCYTYHAIQDCIQELE